jgi:hypothetical protein
MSVSIITLYEVYNAHAITLRSLLKSRSPETTIHILNAIPRYLRLAEYKPSSKLHIFITSDEFLYFFQNLRDEYKLDGCVFVNVRNLYPGMIAYKYKSFRHIYNALCQGRPIDQLPYSIIKSEHHFTFFDGVTDYKLIDMERDILPLFPPTKPSQPTFSLADYAGFWVIGDDKRAQKTVGSVFSSFVPVEYITHHDDARFISRIASDLNRHPNKRFAVLYFENTGIPDFFAIYRLISSAVYQYGKLDLLTIRDEYRKDYLEMYNRWENKGREMSAAELEPLAKQAFEHIQFINPPAIKLDDLMDLLLDDNKRRDIIRQYGNMKKYTHDDLCRDAVSYFGEPVGVQALLRLAPTRQKEREQTHLSSYAVRPFYEVPYTLKGEGVALHLPPLEEPQMERVSVVTPTRHRGLLLMNTVWSLNNSVYPHHLIEWIILDNGDKEAEKTMPDKNRMDVWLPRIKAALNPAIKLKYYQEEANKFSLGELRNRAVAKATAPIIVFMDDDDFYPPESILARVKALNIRPDLRLVGCVKIVNLNVETNQWNMTGLEKYLSEASLAFRRQFWEERPFARQKCNEIALFIYGREDACCYILSQFVIFSVYHKANFTGDLRQIKNDNHKQNIEVELPEEVIARFRDWMKN